MTIKLNFIYLSMFCVNIMGQVYEDKRCRCICPTLESVFHNTSSSERRIFADHVPAMKCNCEDVILPLLGKKVAGHEGNYCLRCDCKFETRNTTIIKVVVVMVLCVMTMLTAYMTFLQCLDPFVHRRDDNFYSDYDEEENLELMLADTEDNSDN